MKYATWVGIPGSRGDVCCDMGWHRVDPRFLRQEEPGVVTVAFVSHGDLDAGLLVLKLDKERRIVRFELSCEPFQSGRECYVEWDAVEGLRTGEVNASLDSGDRWGARMKAAPVVRRYGRPPPDLLDVLLEYVERNGTVLEPEHRRVVVAALRRAHHDGPPTEGSQAETDDE